MSFILPHGVHRVSVRDDPARDVRLCSLSYVNKGRVLPIRDENGDEIVLATRCEEIESREPGLLANRIRGLAEKLRRFGLIDP
jgi:hypothetical protein